MTSRKMENQKELRLTLSDHKMKTSILLTGLQMLNLERVLEIIYSILLVNCISGGKRVGRATNQQPTTSWQLDFPGEYCMCVHLCIPIHRHIMHIQGSPGQWTLYYKWRLWLHFSDTLLFWVISFDIQTKFWVDYVKATFL